MKKPTRVNHPPAVDLPAGNRPLIAPIYQTVKFEFDTLADTEAYLRGERPGFFYTRSGNPTTRQLELLLAELQGRDDCLVTASGVSAIAQALIALTRQGDHIVCFVETYNPSRYLIRRLLGRFGVRHTQLSIEDLAGVERALGTQPTRLVYFESPTNPVTKIADIGALTRLARAAGALTVMDNTFAGFHQHGRYDVDVFVHSLTKYASGAGDVMGGAVIARGDLIGGMRSDFGALGGILDPHAAFLMLRGLRTYFIRYPAQCASAARVAQFLAGHPAVARVHYPGLASHPQHALAAEQMQDFGTIVSFDLAGGADAARRFADALELFALTPSLGSGESLILTA
ncbi:MAG: PLP-dependent transferase, partial [Gammaproteobacteria bacterium]|nr:PLP-dependent transferase [Gammaproteobacteria bacterium]